MILTKASRKVIPCMYAVSKNIIFILFLLPGFSLGKPCQLAFLQESEFLIPASGSSRHVGTLGIEWEGVKDVKRWHANEDIAIVERELLKHLIRKEFPEVTGLFIFEFIENLEYFKPIEFVNSGGFFWRKTQSFSDRTSMLNKLNLDSFRIPILSSEFKITHKPSKKTRTFGIQANSIYSGTVYTSNQSKNTTWGIKSESSIKIKKPSTMTDLEINSPILKTKKDFQRFLSFLDQMIKRKIISLDSIEDNTAAIHIHVGRKGFTNQDTTLLLKAFMLAEQYLYNYFQVSHLREERFANLIFENYYHPFAKDGLKAIKHVLDEYVASIRVHPQLNTFEFRLFNSTEHIETIKHQVQFVIALVNAVSQKDTALMEWVKKMEAQALNSKNKQVKIANQKTLQDKIHPNLLELFSILGLQPIKQEYRAL